MTTFTRQPDGSFYAEIGPGGLGAPEKKTRAKKKTSPPAEPTEPAEVVVGNTVSKIEQGIITKAQNALKSIKRGGKDMRQWWMDVGKALAHGKKITAGGKRSKAGMNFAQWREANGFGELDKKQVSDTLWFVTDEAIGFLANSHLSGNLSYPPAIRAEYRKQQRAANATEPKADKPKVSKTVTQEAKHVIDNIENVDPDVLGKLVAEAMKILKKV